MYQIKRVSIEGFWDSYDFDFELFPDVTFFIGPNGTGKTTLINLIAAALTADIPALQRLPFKRVNLILGASNNTLNPTISVLKIDKKQRSFGEIEYRIRGGKGTKEARFSTEDSVDNHLWPLFSEPRYMRDYYSRFSTGISRALRDIVNVTWISVNRSSLIERERDESPIESLVDQKLEDQSNAMVRYFATLSGEKDIQVASFQEFMFISLIDKFDQTQVDYKKIKNIDYYEATLRSIFEELHVNESRSKDLISSYAARVRDVWVAPRNDAGATDLADLMNLSRIDAIVERWKKLQVNVSQIFRQRERFLSIVNDMLQRKKMEILSSNELQFVSRTGKILPASMLSSGEKQLLILLSEALLQRERPAIFIADEPELSLHVLWQERLVASLRTLNPSAQIMAATHSPDIVGTLSEQAIDMEQLIP